MAPLLPFRLDRGVLLEDSGTLLPWRAPRDSVLTLGRPEVTVRDDVIEVDWWRRWVLGGLNLSVRTTFARHEPRVPYPAAPWHFLDVLAHIRLQPLDFPPDPQPYYREIRARLVEALGEAPETIIDGRPSTSWNFDGVRLSWFIAERFAEWCEMLIVHESALPPGPA